MNVLLIHEEVKIVKGFTRCVIYDLPRRKFYYIDKNVASLLLDCHRKPIEYFRRKCEESEINADDLFNELYEQDILYSFPKQFSDCIQPISLKWESPFHITNAIVDICSNKYLKAIEYLLSINVQHFELRVHDQINEKKLESVFRLFSQSPALCIDIAFLQPIPKNVESLVSKYDRIRNIYIFNSKENKIKRGKFNYNNIVHLQTSSFNQSNGCLVNPEYFIVNIDFFIESSNFNPYFNQKIFFSKNNAFYNSPELVGGSSLQIDSISSRNDLLHFIRSQKFRSYWEITKDDIEVCKDCEYRYMCLDNRIPKQNLAGKWHLDECNYNPYTTEWNAEVF